jgi:hypothetical protein
MLSDARIFFAGVGTSLVSLAVVVVLGQAASHEPKPTRATADPISQLNPIAPAAAENVVVSAPVEPVRAVQAETSVETEKQVGIEPSNKKRDLRTERRKTRAERRAKRLIAQRARQAQQGVAVAKFGVDQR